MFKYIDRKQNNPLILIGGWAFDHRIFDQLDLPYDYFIYHSRSIADFQTAIEKLLGQNSFKKISLLGWSQGAFAVCDFASKNPQLIKEIILIGTRKKHEKRSLEKIKNYLKKNKRFFLSLFYKSCFPRQEKKSYSWFKQTLLNDYLSKMSTSQLIEDLDWISRMQISPDTLKKIERIKIVHGKEDRIAPIAQAMQIAESLPQAKMIVFEHTGHLPFLRDDFRKLLYE